MDEQAQLFDPTRYSPVSVAVYQRLPESSARAFAIASALGTILNQDGSATSLGNGRQASGTLVRKDRLPAILAALGGLSARQWRRYVTAWEEAYVAHRCSAGTVFLFRLPLLDQCPTCKAEIEFDHVAKSPHLNRGAGYGGRSMTAPEDVQRPPRGAGTTAGAAQERPSLSTAAPHQKSGLQGVVVGVTSGSGLLPGVSAIAPTLNACGNCGHEHFGGSGGCRHTTCDCLEAS
jgi:hypothetical protein